MAVRIIISTGLIAMAVSLLGLGATMVASRVSPFTEARCRDGYVLVRGAGSGAVACVSGYTP